MIYNVRDSDSGDLLGSIEVPDDAADEQILELLMAADYIHPPLDYFEITDGDFLTDEGDRCVRDEFGEPVLVLERDGPLQGDDEDESTTEEQDHAE
jgi:hypothetical protein